MGRWIKDNWWVALGGLNAALATMLGVGLPFEDRTLGSVIGGVVIASLGIVGLVGVFVRRRPRRRQAGDLMIGAAQLPWIPFFWAIVPPIIALTVMVAAFIDLSDASSSGHGTAGTAPPSGSSWATMGLLVALVLTVAAAVVVGDPAFALAVPMPLALSLLVHLALGSRLAATPLLRGGAVLLTTPLLWFFSIVLIGALEDGYRVDGAYGVVVEVIAVSMLAVGIGLVVTSVRRGRPARPA